MSDDKTLIDKKNNEKPSQEHEDESSSGYNDSRMGLFSWRPDWLQRFNSIKWFMVALCTASLCQGVIVMGITLVSVPTIEKEFGFSSKITGVIIAGNDAAALVLVTLVSFFGTKAHKPKWIAMGTLITGVGVILFAIPKLIIGDYIPLDYKNSISRPPGFNNMTLSRNLSTPGMPSNPADSIKLMIDVCDVNKVTLPLSVDCAVSGTKILNIIIMFLALFIMGAGTTPIQTLGPAFLDENVTPRASPMYLGIFFATTMLGPGLGFVLGSLFLRTFTNGNVPENMPDLNPTDPRWIGAWWLGYVSLAGVFVFCSIVLFLFPKKIKRQLKREASIKSGHMPSEDVTIKYNFKGYLKELMKICLNKVFILATLGLTIKTIYAAGMVSFITKLLVLKFGVAPDKAGLMLGIMIMPSMIIGILGGSFIIRKIKVALAARTAAKICVIITVITAANSCIFLIPGCNNTNMAGVRVPYHNTTAMTSLSSKCNVDCKCSSAKYTPVCGSDGITYHSPCYAGCDVILIGADQMPYFGNCSCIPPMQRSQLKGNQSISGKGVNVNKPEKGMSMQGGKQSANSMGGLPSEEQLRLQEMIKDIMPKQEKGMSMQSGNQSANSMGGTPSPEQLRILKMMQDMMRKAQSLFNRATIGKCDRDCKNFYPFIIITVLSIIVTFISGTPHKIMVLRCVPDNQRAFALGTQFLIVRSFSFLPAPIILGSVLDSECITWGYNSCGTKQNCYDYNIENLSKNVVLLGVVTSALSALCYFLAWLWYPKGTDENDNGKLMSAEEAL